MVMPIGCRSLTFGLVYQGFNSGKKVLSRIDEYSRVNIKSEIINKRTFIVVSRLRTSPVINASEKSTFAFQSWVKKESRNCRGVNFSRISWGQDHEHRNDGHKIC